MSKYRVYSADMLSVFKRIVNGKYARNEDCLQNLTDYAISYTYILRFAGNSHFYENRREFKKKRIHYDS